MIKIIIQLLRLTEFGIFVDLLEYMYEWCKLHCMSR